MVSTVGVDLWYRRAGWTRRVLEGNGFHSRGPRSQMTKSDQDQCHLQSPTCSQQPLRTSSGAQNPSVLPQGSRRSRVHQHHWCFSPKADNEHSQAQACWLPPTDTCEVVFHSKGQTCSGNPPTATCKAVSGSVHLHTAELSRSLGHARPGPLSSARHGCLHC